MKVTSTMKRFTHELNVHCGESFDEAELKGMAKLMADHGVVASGYEVRRLFSFSAGRS